MHDHECDVNEVFIEQLIDGELSYEESAELSRHIDTCSRCRAIRDEYLLMKRTVRNTFAAEQLSADEKAKFTRLIAENRPSFTERFLLTIKTFFSAHEFVVAVGSILVISIISVLFFRMQRIDQRGEDIIDQIMALHRNNLPREFSGTDNVDDIIERNLSFRPRIGRIIRSDDTQVNGRFVTIGTRPAASLKLQQSDGNTTLFLSRNNETLRRLFKSARCSTALGCRARVKKKNGRDLMYMRKRDEDYLLIGNDNAVNERFIRLISDE